MALNYNVRLALWFTFASTVSCSPPGRSIHFSSAAARTRVSRPTTWFSLLSLPSEAPQSNVGVGGGGASFVDDNSSLRRRLMRLHHHRNATAQCLMHWLVAGIYRYFSVHIPAADLGRDANSAYGVWCHYSPASSLLHLAHSLCSARLTLAGCATNLGVCDAVTISQIPHRDQFLCRTVRRNSGRAPGVYCHRRRVVCRQGPT